MQAWERFLVVVVTLVTPLAAKAATPLVKIDSGIVQGKNVGTVNAFLGIPYAAPPVGKLRWKAPEPAGPSGRTSARRPASARAACRPGFIPTWCFVIRESAKTASS